jgi:very-short-patch-repair endonuclease/predicted transcriptional regulator of viral defense system
LGNGRLYATQNQKRTLGASENGESESAVRTIERRIARLAMRQHGVVTRRQLLEVGLSASAVSRRLRTGRLSALHLGVYQVGPLAMPHAREMSAVLACAGEAVVSHRNAAVLWRLVPPAPVARPIHVIVAGLDRGRREGIRAHRVDSIPPDEVTRFRRIPITTAARTLTDLASELDERALEQALSRVERRGLATIAEILAVLSRRPRRAGAATLRSLLDQGASFTRSEAEDRLRTLIGRAELPPPRLNARAAGFEVDALWSDHRVVVEVDGFAFHSSRASFEADRDRDASLTAAGFTVLRVTWRHLVRGPEAFVARLAAALARAREPDRR